MTIYFKPQVFMRKTVDGVLWELFKNEDIPAAIASENQIQDWLNDFHNIRVEPYTGRKYKKDLFSWLVVEKRRF